MRFHISQVRELSTKILESNQSDISNPLWFTKLAKRRRSWARKRITSSSGSAILEFILLALPLFIPLAIFLTNVSQASTITADLQNYARQYLRAYVTSPDTSYLQQRMDLINRAFEENFFKKDGLKIPVGVNLICTNTPCLSPGGLIRVEVHAFSSSTGKTYFVTATGSAGPWRNS